MSWKWKVSHLRNWPCCCFIERRLVMSPRSLKNMTEDVMQVKYTIKYHFKYISEKYIKSGLKVHSYF